MDDIEAYKEVLLNNLFRFNEEILLKDRPGNQLSVQPHLNLCNVVQDWSKKRMKLVLMPRDTFKSTVVTEGYAIQQILKNPNIRILIGSDLNATAKIFLGNIKSHLETNRHIHELWGDHVRKKSKWGEDSITSALRTINLKEPTVFTTGSDMSRTGFHCDLAILDDPVNKLSIKTREARLKTLEWFKEIVNSILESTGHMIVIGTRYHHDDIYNWIIKEMADEFDFVVEQAMSDSSYDVLRSDLTLDQKERLIKNEELLFPKRLGVKELWSKYKNSDVAFFNNQYMNRVVATEDADFKEMNFMYYDPAGTKTIHHFMTTNDYILIDPAISEEKRADSTAIICVGIDKVNNWFVKEYEVGKFSPDQIVAKTFDMYRRHPNVLKIGVEVVAFQKALMYIFRDEEKKRRARLPLIPLERDTQTAKEMRIRGILQPVINQKRLYMQKGMIELIEQLKDFPRGSHDDIIDALADVSQVAGSFRTVKNNANVEERERDRKKARRWKQRSEFTAY